MIYIVQGTTGEYSDRSDWLVCAYRTKEAAETRARNAMLRAMEIKNAKPDQYSNIPEGMKNEFDKSMSMDYTGTEYTVLEVELLEE